MKSFSKRHKFPDTSGLFDKARRRIGCYIKSCVGSDFFLPCVVMIKDDNNKILNEQQVSDFSVSELGYDIMSGFNNDEYTFTKSSKDENGKRVLYYSDKKFADFIEIMIVFCKDKRREEFVSYINDTLQDESSALFVNGWMIMFVQPEGLSSLLPLIKDALLANKLKPLYSEATKNIGGSTKSRLAADALQLIFSSDKRGETKAESERIVEKMAARWTDKNHKEEFVCIINDTVKLIKAYNNSISNIRHTDKSTMRVRGESMYDFVASINTAMIGLALETLQDELISLENPTEIRNRFLKTYKINPSKSEHAHVSDNPADFSDIPF